MTWVEFKKLDARAEIPKYMSEGAAGMDLAACLPEDPSLGSVIVLRPMERKLVPTGLAVAIPSGFEGQVRSRSGLTLKKGLVVPNSPGTIDSDYRGHLGVLLCNLSDVVVTVTHGERIAQLVISPVARVTVLERVDGDLPPTRRGAGGFGSTGC